MRFFKNIFSPQKSDTPFRRWSDEELKERRAYLESKPAESYSPDDHYLLAEWLVQRYLPIGEEPNPEMWARQRARLKAKIDANLAAQANGTLKNFEPIASSRYTVTESDFFEKIVPCLKAFDFMPPPFMRGRSGDVVWKSLYRLTGPYSPLQSIAREDLMGLCDAQAAMTLVQELSRTYEALTRAKEGGSIEVKVVMHKGHCSSCMALQGSLIGVDELLAGFESACPRFPHAIAWSDEIQWCHAPYLTPQLALREGDDPDFHEWLKNTLKQRS